MKYASGAICVECFLITVLSAALLSAQPPAPPRTDDAPSPGVADVLADTAQFKELDISEDGFLSGKEARTVLQFDLNNDGRVTLAEFLAGRALVRRAKAGPDRETLFRQLDGNEDGVLSGKEARGYLHLDANGDEEISPAEFLAGGKAAGNGPEGKRELVTYRNLKEKISRRHQANFVPFQFSFHKGWSYDTAAGTEESPNVVKVERNANLGQGLTYTQENFAVGSCDVPGTGEIAKIGLQYLSSEFQRKIALGFRNFKLNREGEFKFAGLKGYGFDFSSTLTHPVKGSAACWGRVILLPNGELKQNHGVTIIMLATSEAPEIKGIEDLGVKGQLPSIIESFRVGEAAGVKPPVVAPPVALPVTPPPKI